MGKVSLVKAYYAADEAAMEEFGAVLLAATQGTGIIHLIGDLGMGKTTISRGILRAAGHKGAVKSPTYTLVEPYDFADKHIYHFDLYRLLDPEELEFLGIRDYFTQDSLCLVEWPDKGEGLLPRADLELHLTLWSGPDLPEPGREIRWTPVTEKGQDAVQRIETALNSNQ